MGRYLKGPFPLGSVLCTYERPLEIQYYNTIQYHFKCRPTSSLRVVSWPTENCKLACTFYVWVKFKFKDGKLAYTHVLVSESVM